MHKRQFLVSTAAMFAASGLQAQTPRLRRVAIAAPIAANVPNEGIKLFKQRLTDLGWVEGRNVEYVYGYAGGEATRYEPVIVEMLAQKPDVLLAYFHPMAMVAKKLTREVPIVFTISSNPEESGLVASLARPGGNVTGASTRALELDGKRLELLLEIKPEVKRMAVAVNPSLPEVARRFSEAYGKIAGKLGVKLLTVEIRSAGDVGPAFDQMARDGVQAILGTADPTHLFGLRASLVSHAARIGIPEVHVDERYVEAGALVSYGTDNIEQFRRGANYVDRILRGAKPAELPVEEPTNFRMVLNLRTAKALKITVPQSVLVRADLVIS